ncbi:SPOR domain-containing protein [Alteromonas marina]|uniref:SPOR domain-containing protein n=1 Tax=unclassified Alteromonas TaxID=2614992 RepID=UPI00090A1E2C|nr:SPOR domain-containing protein [Alteromonas sp. KUL150]APD86696.1 dedD protein [Alteromonas sp. Mex14]GFD74919.1 cell division protein DedD [Tenacibaculum sp. KUL113]GFD84406.1 cell division protein DedD [Alteromonas sp. KUL150]
MTSALKNRLVGTIIVVALAVIFLPDFLDGKKQTNREPFVSVPANPPKKPIVEPEPFPSERVAKAAVPAVEIEDETAIDDEPMVSSRDEDSGASVTQAPKEKVFEEQDNLASQTVIDNKGAAADDDAGWVIQLGSFRHEKNVKALLAKLERAGYRAFSRKIQTSSGPLNKVFVGPDLDKNKLESALPHLKELTSLKGKVTTFKVE